MLVSCSVSGMHGGIGIKILIAPSFVPLTCLLCFFFFHRAVNRSMTALASIEASDSRMKLRMQIRPKQAHKPAHDAQLSEHTRPQGCLPKEACAAEIVSGARHRQRATPDKASKAPVAQQFLDLLAGSHAPPLRQESQGMPKPSRSLLAELYHT